MKIYPLFSSLVLVLAVAVRAQSTLPPPLPPESRQFDFWLGEWEVTAPDGKPQGTNRIEAIAGGAGLLENWTGNPLADGGTGKSLNAFNQSRHVWQQFWVGSGGGILELTGQLVKGEMVLEGSHLVAGRSLSERITWTPNADGTVRQHWEQSTDQGGTWSTVFDGLYRKKKPN